MLNTDFEKDNVTDRPVAEFMYSVICATPLKKKQAMPVRLYKQINTERKAKKFCEKSSTDQKRELLSYLDVGFFWTFVGLKEFTSKDYIPIMKEFKKGNTVGAISKMCERGVCITTDLEFSFLMSQMAQGGASKTYIRDMEKYRAGSMVRSWKAKFNPSIESQDIEKSAFAVSKIIEKTLSYSRRIESIVNLKEYEYRVLNLLYVKKNEYIDFSYIWDYFTGEVPRRKFSSSIVKLTKEMLIQKHPEARKYTITKSGIRAVNIFLDKIVQSLNF